MLRLLLKRFLLTPPALWLVLTLVFLMIHIVPGDPVEQMLGEGAAPGQLTQLHWDWICRCTRSMDITCGNSVTAISGNPSSFKRRFARSFLNGTLRRSNSHSLRL